MSKCARKRSLICLLDSGSGNGGPLAEAIIHKDLSAIRPMVAAGHRGRLKDGVQDHTSVQTSNWPATVRGGSHHLKPLSSEARPINFTNTFWDSERPNEERDSWPVLGGGGREYTHHRGRQALRPLEGGGEAAGGLGAHSDFQFLRLLPG